MASPPTVSTPPAKFIVVDKMGRASIEWARWFQQIYNRVGGANGKPVVGDVAVFEATIGQADVASAASKAIITANPGEQWKIRHIMLSGGGTNFSGGSGDRNLSITDGTTTWSVIPAATLQSLAAARWGDTGLAFPTTAAHMTTASASGTNVSAKNSGGTNDYTAGSCTVIVTAERIA